MRKPAVRRVRPRLTLDQLPVFDAAEYLNTEGVRLEYLRAALEGRDIEFMRRAISDVERSRWMRPTRPT